MGVTVHNGRFYITRSNTVVGPMYPTSEGYASNHAKTQDASLQWDKKGRVISIVPFPEAKELVQELTLVRRNDSRALVFRHWEVPNPEECGVSRENVLIDMNEPVAVQKITAPPEDKPVAKSEERIVSAALYIQGLIISLPAPARHHTIQHACDLSHAVITDAVAMGVQGFITTTGRFVNRVEGYYLAHAAKQIEGKKVPELFSEDLW